MPDSGENAATKGRRSKKYDGEKQKTPSGNFFPFEKSVKIQWEQARWEEKSGPTFVLASRARPVFFGSGRNKI
jgi:hypothetical protein